VSEEVLINVTPRETRVAVVAAGVVQELLIERPSGRGLVGNLYMGRVARVLPGMQSAFIDIGLERAAFLHVADIWENREPGKPIEKILAEGSTLLVQVVKDPIGSKGARLSTQVSLAGRLLVYLPALSSNADPHIGISQKIEDENGRAQLRERLKELVPADEKGGFIVRTLAEAAAEDELAADIAYLRQLWATIRERSLGARPPEEPAVLSVVATKPVLHLERLTRRQRALPVLPGSSEIVGMDDDLPAFSQQPFD
jgi:ribonuclease G